MEKCIEKRNRNSPLQSRQIRPLDGEHIPVHAYSYCQTLHCILSAPPAPTTEIFQSCLKNVERVTFGRRKTNTINRISYPVILPRFHIVMASRSLGSLQEMGSRYLPHSAAPACRRRRKPFLRSRPSPPPPPSLMGKSQCATCRRRRRRRRRRAASSLANWVSSH